VINEAKNSFVSGGFSSTPPEVNHSFLLFRQVKSQRALVMSRGEG